MRSTYNFWYRAIYVDFVGFFYPFVVFNVAATLSEKSARIARDEAVWAVVQAKGSSHDR